MLYDIKSTIPSSFIHHLVFRNPYFNGTQKEVNGDHGCQVRYFVTNRRVKVLSLHNAILSYDIMLWFSAAALSSLEFNSSWSPFAFNVQKRHHSYSICRFGAQDISYHSNSNSYFLNRNLCYMESSKEQHSCKLECSNAIILYIILLYGEILS